MPKNCSGTFAVWRDQLGYTLTMAYNKRKRRSWTAVNMYSCGRPETLNVLGAGPFSVDLCVLPINTTLWSRVVLSELEWARRIKLIEECSVFFRVS